MIYPCPKPAPGRTKTRKWIRAIRPTLRRGELTPLQKTAIRLTVYERAGGKCELKLSSDCIKGVLPLNGETALDHGHLVHLKAKRRHGWGTAETLKFGCWHCHLVGLHGGGKVVPKKTIDPEVLALKQLLMDDYRDHQANYPEEHEWPESAYEGLVVDGGLQR